MSSSLVERIIVWVVAERETGAENDFLCSIRVWLRWLSTLILFILTKILVQLLIWYYQLFYINMMLCFVKDWNKALHIKIQYIAVISNEDILILCYVFFHTQMISFPRIIINACKGRFLSNHFLKCNKDLTKSSKILSFFLHMFNLWEMYVSESLHWNT